MAPELAPDAAPGLRFAANLTTLFPGMPLPDRFAAASALGFTLAEIQYPYALGPAELRARLDAAGLTLVLMNAPPGNPGEKGIACLPGRQDEFRASIERALDYTAAAGSRKLHVLSGTPAPDSDPVQVREILLANLGWAAAQCASAGVTMLIEALNAVDAPGYAVPTQAAAIDVVRAVNHPACKVLYDVYHCLMRGEDPMAAFDQCEALIGHVQIADAPGRGEPGTGTGDWPALFARFSDSPAALQIGCEFKPLASSAEDLRLWRWICAREAAIQAGLR